MEIEEVAKTHPDSIIVEPVNIAKGFTDEQAKKLCEKLEIDPKQQKDAADQMKKLYKMFVDLDNVQLEINPWATDPKGLLWMIDAKINVDDNAKFR